VRVARTKRLCEIGAARRAGDMRSESGVRL
jgi:hypothetical protein